MLVGLTLAGCSPGTDGSGARTSGTPSHGGQGGSSSTIDPGKGGSTSISVGGGSSDPSGGLGCPTTLSGTVFDPAGTLPLYNVVVYVPSEPLAPLSSGASCETCDGNFSGRPIAAAVSDAAGHFSLDISRLTSASDIPLVVQVGKWRRQVKVPSATVCADTPVDAALTRLPRNKAEGDLPKLAVVRGGSDALECLIRKIGVSDSEFTTDTGDGRVHLYVSPTGTATAGTGQMAGGVSLPTADSLYGSLDKMMGYDAVLMACEGTDNTIASRPLPQFQNVRTYADQGGRIFGSHYNSQFIWSEEHTPTLPYPVIVKFASGAHGFADGFVAQGNVNASFPKGAALRDWLVNVHASTTPGQVPIQGGEHTIDSVIHPNAVQWISTTDDRGHMNVIQYFSFPTPIDGQACGRMVFSDLHVASGTGDSGKVAFPMGCTSSDLSPQEKALAFMVFDLSSCVQPETDDVKPPTIF